MSLEVGATSVDLPRCAGVILAMAGHQVDTPTLSVLTNQTCDAGFQTTPGQDRQSNAAAGARGVRGTGGAGGGGGGNNRVYRVQAAGKTFVLKQYFQHPDDPRDRMAAEFTFIRWAWNRGLRCVPMPVGRLFQMNLALYGFVPGRRLAPGEITAEQVTQAVRFVQAINQGLQSRDAQEIPLASDSCFTLQQHLDHVTRRVHRLLTMPMASPEHQQALTFVQRELKPSVDRHVQAFLTLAQQRGWEMNRPLTADQRWLSPSDFGFHNALVDERGNLSFIDFEYAGWDDPRKIVADFFTQVAVPVPLEYWDLMAQTLLTDDQRQQAWALLAVYRMKWACLVLNAFLPVDQARRRFARGPSVDPDHLSGQLAAAQRLCRDQKEMPPPTPLSPLSPLSPPPYPLSSLDERIKPC